MAKKENLEIERRFKLRDNFSEADLPKGLKYKVFIVYQDYLKKRKNGGRRRIRRMWQHSPNCSDPNYFFTEKKSTPYSGTNIEDEKRISLKKYRAFFAQLDPTRETVEKKRIVFFWKRQKFELDIFWAPRRLRGLVILEIELKKRNQKVALPDFLLSSIEMEITDVPGYSNADLAKRRKTPS